MHEDVRGSLCVFTFLACVLGTSAGAAGLRGADLVVINEVHYHPADDVRESEFVELFNDGDQAVDLGGWFLVGGVQFTFPSPTVLGPQAFILVAADATALRARYQLDAGQVAGSYSGSLSNSGEQVELWTNTGYLMSYIQYSDSDPWPETTDGLGPSLERISPRREEADARAWAASILVGGTPGEPNSARIEDPASPGTNAAFVPSGSTWRFFRGRREPPTDWRATSFDASSWEEGAAGIGYGDGDDVTVLTDMQNQYTTIYVRRTFQVSNPAAIQTLELSTLYDDGYVAYINGTEVDRINLAGIAGDPVAYNAVTSTNVEPAIRRTIDITYARDHLVVGTNVLALHAVNSAIDNSDLSLDPSLSGAIATGTPTSVTYVPEGEDWRFFRGSSAPPAEWRELSFVDADWELGPSGFGYGDGDDATVLSDMQDGYLTVLARRGFQVTDASKISSLTITVDYDDGFIAYLNGTEVARANVNTAGHDTTANASHEAGTPADFDVPNLASVLRTGLNVIAIEGHNNRLDSTDFSLAPSVTGVILPDDVPPLPEPAPPRPPREVVINEIYPDAGGNGWVEVYNAGAQSVSLSGKRLELFPSTSGRYTFPAGSTLGSGERLVVAEADLGFSLVGIANLILSSPEGYYLDGLNPRTTADGYSTGRWPDGYDNRHVFTTPTMGTANTIQLESRVVINEIMFHPEDLNAGGEFIELHNRSTTASVDVSGWSFTRGVEYTMPAGTVIPPGGYLVIAADPDAAAAHYAIPRPLGPYVGRLNNDAETLLLRDALGNQVDRVRYADEGSWPEVPDGEGPSVELLHPALENRYGPSWASSTGEGTPGTPNSSRMSNPPPVVVDVQHRPAVPAPTDTVRVTALLSDERSITSATLFWQADGTSTSNQVILQDDGVHDDGIASNGIYGAEIPPRPDKGIVQFWIQAQAEGGQTVTVPTGAPSPAFLYQVDAAGPQQVRPLYRIVMKAADLNTLRTRDRYSDVLLDCTFIEGDRAYYNRGVRYRGRSARNCNPLSYRVQFDHDRDLNGIKRLDINGCNSQRQWSGLDYLFRTGIDTPQCWFRKLAINAAVESGNHLRVEAVDDQFLDRVRPDDASGNLYRGEAQANLDYRGTTFSSYTSNYLKVTNEALADWSDVVALCRSFDSDTTSNADFPATIEAAIDIEQWALYFAAFALLGSTEGGILLDNGDDYYLYHRPSDGRWILLPWDLDSCFDDSQQVLFRPTVDQIERFLEHPRYAPSYWCHLQELMAGAFDSTTLNSRIDHLTPLFNSTVVNQLRSFVTARRNYVSARLRTAITVTVLSGGSLCGSTIVATGPTLSLEGFAPGCGTTEVRIDGTPGTYNPQTNFWSGSAPVTGGSQLVIEAIDRDGFLVARRRLTVESVTAYTTLPASISSSRTLIQAESPYRISGTTTVAAGVTLSVEAGVTVTFDAGAALVVEGTLVVDGTAEQPAVFTVGPCAIGQEGIVLSPGAPGTRLSHARFVRLGRAAGFTAGVGIESGTVDADHLGFEGSGAGTALEVRGGATLHLDAIAIRDMDRGILAGPSSVTILGSDIEECGESAVRLGAGASATIERCLLHDNTTAIVATSGATLDMSHVTIYASTVGIDAREESAGSGGGHITADSLIVWNVGEAFRTDATSTVNLSFSDVDGSGVPPGSGNINADPRFARPSAQDFRISYFSPCRGAGKDGTDMGAFPYEPLGETGTFLRCDTNNDGENDLSDGVFTLLNLFAGGSAPACPASSDCNVDGNVDLSDVVFSLNYLFLAGEPPPPPYPGCDEAELENCPGQFCPGG